MTDMPGERSHAALIHAVAASRDRAAFAMLFSHYAPRVKTFLQRRGADAAQAEELAQEALLAVWRKADQFDPGRATAAAWIFAIARNLRIDALRRARLAIPVADPSDAPEPPPAADALLSADQRARRLHDAIAALPAEQSEALRLAYFDERSHSEMETALAIPLGTVKSRLRLAMARLRAALGEDA
ncbi:MAG: sigma-70 family RNA polymerase sigma factor [Rhodospirillales bacterium]|nr:sigma-70 family RNA polymerase sigma factor [Rhodospirillales bacterium]